MELESSLLSILKKLGIGTGYDIPEEDDKSGLGANLEIMSLADAKATAEDSDFMQAAGQSGYIPVGNCMVNPGDVYCVNSTDPHKRGLYRLTLPTGTLSPVLDNISTMTRYKGK